MEKISEGINMKNKIIIFGLVLVLVAGLVRAEDKFDYLEWREELYKPRCGKNSFCQMGWFVPMLNKTLVYQCNIPKYGEMVEVIPTFLSDGTNVNILNTITDVETRTMDYSNKVSNCRLMERTLVDGEVFIGFTEVTEQRNRTLIPNESDHRTIEFYNITYQIPNYGMGKVEKLIPFSQPELGAITMDYSYPEWAEWAGVGTLNQSLILSCYGFDNNSATEVDYAGNYNLAKSGSPAFSEGSNCTYGGCYYFDASTEFFSTATWADPDDHEDGWFVCGWANTTDTAQSFVFDFGVAYGTNIYFSGPNAPVETINYKLGFDAHNGVAKYTVGVGLHFCMSHNSTHDVLWINGTIVDQSAPGTNQVQSTQLRIAGETDGEPSLTFDGIIDEMIFGNKTNGLTQADVDDIYNNKRSCYELFSSAQASATESEGDDAIEMAINSSVPSASKYSSQQVYARDLDNNQDRGKFDWFVTQSSPARRWAINYVTTDDPTSGFTNMFNITPVLYVLELQDLTEVEITDAVGDMINSTK